MSRLAAFLLSLCFLGVLLAAVQGLFVSKRAARRAAAAEAAAAAPRTLPVVRPLPVPELPGEGLSAPSRRRSSGSVPMFGARPLKASAPAAAAPVAPEKPSSARPPAARTGAPAPRAAPKPLMRMLGGVAAGAPSFDGGAAPAPDVQRTPEQPVRSSAQPSEPPPAAVEAEAEEAPRPQAVRRSGRAVSHGGAGRPALPQPRAAPASFGAESGTESEDGGE
ncbi:MAG: hypothetical protein WC969_07565 [Elusimicrobiota bacterium]